MQPMRAVLCAMVQLSASHEFSTLQTRVKYKLSFEWISVEEFNRKLLVIAF